jgi:iron complex outermembrane receptor protein
MGATQSFDLSFGKASIHADYSYVSSRAYYQNTADPGDPTQSPADYAAANQLGITPGYGLLSARAALTLKNPDLEIAFWGRNLTATQYFQAEYDLWTALGVVERYQGNPRTYGINLTYRW